MKMRYRGISYDRHPIVPSLKTPGSHVNSGIAYVRLSATRFMGQACQQPTVNLAIAKKQTRFLGRICSFDATEPTQINATV